MKKTAQRCLALAERMDCRGHHRAAERLMGHAIILAELQRRRDEDSPHIIHQCMGTPEEECALIEMEDGTWGWPFGTDPMPLRGSGALRRLIELGEAEDGSKVSHGICPRCYKRYMEQVHKDLQEAEDAA